MSRGFELVKVNFDDMDRAIFLCWLDNLLKNDTSRELTSSLVGTGNYRSRPNADEFIPLCQNIDAFLRRSLDNCSIMDNNN